MFFLLILKMRFILVFLLLISGLVNAQDRTVKVLEERGDYFKKVKLNVSRNTFYTNLDPSFLATSLSVELPEGADHARALIFLGTGQSLSLKQDAHFSEDTATRSGFQSELMIAPSPFRYFSFFSGDLEGPVFFKLLYAKPLREAASLLKKKH